MEIPANQEGRQETRLEAAINAMEKLTTPYRLIHAMRHQLPSVFPLEDQLLIRQSLFIQLNGLVGVAPSPPSTPFFNERFQNYLSLPEPAPLAEMINNRVPAHFMDQLTELAIGAENVLSAQPSNVAGWSQTRLVKANTAGQRPKEIRGNAGNKARNFISGVRRLISILRGLKVTGARFIRVETALDYFLPSTVPGRAHGQKKFYRRHSHKVSCQELWAEKTAEG